MVAYKALTFKDFSQTIISLHQWSSNVNPKYVILICHGLAEHGTRYAPLAHYLAQKNCAVYAIDLRGHGLTSKETGLGIIGQTDSYHSLVKNINEAKSYINALHPDSLFILLGHSMGSFLVQSAIQKDSSQVAGLILSGTSIEPGLLLSFGKGLSRFLGLLFTMTSPSLLIKFIIFLPYILPFIPYRSKYDWLCSVDQVVDDFLNDPLCNFRPSFQLFYALFDVLDTIYKKESLELIPKELPILLFSGAEDPLAKNQKALHKVVEKYHQTGHHRVQLKYYPKGRHEMLLEYNKEQVFSDIYTWLLSL